MKPTIYIGADHRAFALKEQLRGWLLEAGYQVVDCGNHQLDPDDDYPQIAFTVAEQVAAQPDQARGIVMCGSGVGVTVAANKVDGIRAAQPNTTALVKHARTNDNINILSIAADVTDLAQAKALSQTFLETEYQPTARYEHRINQIAAYEEHN